MSDVFRVTLNQFLKMKMQIQFITFYLTYLQIKTRTHLQKWLHNALIINYCNKINRKFTQSKKRRRHFVDFTSRKRKRFWFKNFCAKLTRSFLMSTCRLTKNSRKRCTKNEKLFKTNIKWVKNEKFAWHCRFVISKNI